MKSLNVSSLKPLEQFSPDFTSVETMLAICLNGSAPLNKIPAMPIYGKALKTIFSRTKNALWLNLGIQHQGLEA